MSVRAGVNSSNSYAFWAVNNLCMHNKYLSCARENDILVDAKTTTGGVDVMLLKIRGL